MLLRTKNKTLYNVIYFFGMFCFIVFYEGLEIFGEDINLYICGNSTCNAYWSSDWLHESRFI